MFSVRDKVIHPAYGAGTIVSIEQKKIGSQQQKYYIIELLTTTSTLMVPVEGADNLGLRYPVEHIESVLQVLGSKPTKLSKDHRERQDEIWATIRTGDTMKISKVVRNLAWRDRENKLTIADARLFQRAHDFLVGELALCQGIEVDSAREQVKAALEKMTI